MKLILITIFLQLSPLISSGQSSQLHIKLIDSACTWRNATWERIDSFYFNLQPLKTSKFDFHARIYSPGQTIDLYGSGNETYRGRLLNYITEYKIKKERGSEYDDIQSQNYVFEFVQLDEKAVSKMIQELIRTDQMNIPTDTAIVGWSGGSLHCKALTFEFKFKQKYSKQVYSCPWGQNDSISFKKTILDNYNHLMSTFDLDSLYRNFENRLTGGKTYSKDGYGMMYKMTEKQSESWQRSKPQRDYMKSMKDTIDFLLKSRIKSQKIDIDGIDCFADYRLTFNTTGKLSSIKTSKYDQPTLKNSLGLGDYFTEKREIRKCKSKIREIFRNMDMEFLNLKYEFYRTLSYDNSDGFQLRDETIY